MSLVDHLLIDGELVTGKGSEFTVTDPATGESFATLHSSSGEQLAAATAAAKRAQPEWHGLSQPERSKALHSVV